MTDLDYCKVVGRFSVVIGPGKDETPCSSGLIRFTPLQSYSQVPGAVPDPIGMTYPTVEAGLDSNGYLSYKGNRYVDLVDFGSIKINPRAVDDVATYKVEFEELYAGGYSVDIETFYIRPDPLLDNDLPSMVPVDIKDNIYITVGPRGPRGPSGGGGGGSDNAISVTEYGAVGDGVTDDTVSIQAAMDAAYAMGGGDVHLAKGGVYGWSGVLKVRPWVRLCGTVTRQNLAPTAPPTVPGLVALSANSQLQIGAWEPDGHPAGVQNLYVDGNFVGGNIASVTGKGLVRITGVDLYIEGLFCIRSAGEGIVYNGMQNSTIVGGGSTFNVGGALVLDNGPGALAFHGGYYGTSKGGALVCRDTPGENNLYPFGPTHISFTGTIFEAYTNQASPVEEPYAYHMYLSGRSINFFNCNFTAGAQNSKSCTIFIDDVISWIPGLINFFGGIFWVRQGYDAVKVTGSTLVNFEGLIEIGDDGVNHPISFLCADGGYSNVSLNGEIVMSGNLNGVNTLRAINGGELATGFSNLDTGVNRRLRAGQVVSQRREGDTYHRYYTDRDGVTVWFDGVSGYPSAYIQRNADKGKGLDYFSAAGGEHNFVGAPVRVESLYFGADIKSFDPNGPAGIAETLPLRAYGNSYLADTGNALSIYFNRARRQLNSKSWDNRGVSGYRVYDGAWIAYDNIPVMHQGTASDEQDATVASAQHIPSMFPGGMFLLDILRNDAGHDGNTASTGTTAKARAGAENGLNAMISLIRAGSYKICTDASFTYTGTWLGNAGLPGVYDHSVKYTSTPGDKVSISAIGPNFDLVLLAIDDGSLGVVGSQFSIKVDGSPYTAMGYPTTLSNQMGRTKGGGPVKYGPLIIPIRDLSNGTHTIELTHTGGSGDQLYVNALVTPTHTPPTVIISKVNYLATAGYNTYKAIGGIGSSKVIDDVYNDIIDTVVGQYPDDGSIQVIDPNALGFDPVYMIGSSDGLAVHLSDYGNNWYATNLVNKIRNLPPRQGLVRL